MYDLVGKTNNVDNKQNAISINNLFDLVNFCLCKILKLIRLFEKCTPKTAPLFISSDQTI